MGIEYLRNFEFGSAWTVIDQLAPIILSNVMGSIIEIGMGNSTLMLLKHAIKYNRFMMSCDRSDQIVNRIKNAIDKHDLNHKNHYIHQCTSTIFIENLKETLSKSWNHEHYTPAMIFIDGNHHYENTKIEVDYFLSILPQNAMMFLHDTFPLKYYYEAKMKRGGNKADSYKIRHYLESKDDLFTFTWPYTASYCGLTMVMKKDPTRP